MDRREMLKNAGGAFAATAVGMSGLSESIQSRAMDDYRNGRVMTTEQYAEEVRKRMVPDDRPKPYDPVAVLEAIRKYPRFDCTSMHVTSVGYWTTFYDGMRNVFLLHGEAHEDFATAVRWLHRQAASVDKEFARAWPVPEEA